MTLPFRLQPVEQRMMQISVAIINEQCFGQCPSLGSEVQRMAAGGTSVGPVTGSSVTSTMPVSTAVVPAAFIAFTFLRASFLVPERLGLALARRFRGIGLAVVGFAAFRRSDLEAFRTLARPVDLPLRAVARFLR